MARSDWHGTRARHGLGVVYKKVKQQNRTRNIFKVSMLYNIASIYWAVGAVGGCETVEQGLK